MLIEGQLQAAAARCLSILLRYRNGERTAATKAMMVAEIEVVVGWLMELGLPSGVVETEVLAPVGTYLLARYGHEAGQRLNTEFVEAFEAAGMDLIAHDPRCQIRCESAAANSRATSR
jgi:hypothetical protein